MLEGRHFQNAYVTRDIDKAIDAFRSRHGVTAEITTLTLDQELWTPARSGVARQKIAYFWIGDLQYELIQPIEGNVATYAEGLSDGDVMKFHHVGIRIDDWDDFRDRVDRQGIRVAVEGCSGTDLRFLYLDARDTVGHFLEYVWCTPVMWDVISAGKKAPRQQ